MIVITSTISILFFGKKQFKGHLASKKLRVMRRNSLTHQPQQKTVAFQGSYLRHVVYGVNWEFYAKHWLRLRHWILERESVGSFRESVL